MALVDFTSNVEYKALNISLDVLNEMSIAENRRKFPTFFREQNRPQCVGA